MSNFTGGAIPGTKRYKKSTTGLKSYFQKKRKNRAKLQKATGAKAMRAANVERFGEKAIKRTESKSADFKKMRSGKMSKEDFIKKYPDSITARKAKGKGSRFKSTRKKRRKTPTLSKSEVKYPSYNTFRGI